MVLRRLIAPSLITVVLCGLWVDYLFFRDSRWSATNFLANALAILVRIFGPLLDPALYWWVGEVIVPAVLVPCGIILLYISVAKAKVAMSKATPNPDQTVPLAPPVPVSAPAAESVAEAATPQAAPRPWKFGLVGKLAASFGVLSLLFGVSVTVIVYARMADALEKEIKQRVGVFAASLGEIAGRGAALPEQPELNNALDKYASSRSIAYIYVEDGAGRIVAHRPRELPVYLRRDFPKSGERALHGVDLDYRGLPVYEIAVRVGDSGGYAHLAVWRDIVEDETRRVVAPVAGAILVLLSGVTLLFTWVAWTLTRPFIKLVDSASRVSKGDLETEITTTGTDEVGELAQSFSRMRSSLHAVLSRLEESASAERSNEQG